MLVLETKWMNIFFVANKSKTKVFEVFSKDGNFLLGEIKWYGPFRKYSFFPSANSVFEFQCLTDITGFIKKLMDERKANGK